MLLLAGMLLTRDSVTWFAAPTSYANLMALCATIPNSVAVVWSSEISFLFFAVLSDTSHTEAYDKYFGPMHPPCSEDVVASYAILALVVLDARGGRPAPTGIKGRLKP